MSRLFEMMHLPPMAWPETKWLRPRMADYAIAGPKQKAESF